MSLQVKVVSFLIRALEPELMTASKQYKPDGRLPLLSRLMSKILNSACSRTSAVFTNAVAYSYIMNAECGMFVNRKTLAEDAPDDFDSDVSVLVARVLISVLNQVSACFIVCTSVTY